jgi:long-subunit acyl-CoA synthetase (AMP-forming)
VCNTDTLAPGLSEQNPGLAISPDTPVYIFYTSGSTGTPKGVVDTHRNVLHNIMRYTNSLHISTEDRPAVLILEINWYRNEIRAPIHES